MAQPPRPSARSARPRSRQGPRAVLGGGAIGGLIAGAVALAAGMAWTSGLGLGAGLLPHALAGWISGPMSLLGGAGTGIAGWLAGLAGAALLGLLYAALGWNVRSYGTALLWGILFAIMVWAAFARWVLPAVNPILAAYLPLLGPAWFFLHVLYGVVLSLSAPIRHGLSESQPETTTWQLPKAG